MTISENKHSWMKIIIAIAMSFCGLLGIQMQYLNYTFTGLGKEIVVDLINYQNTDLLACL